VQQAHPLGLQITVKKYIPVRLALGRLRLVTKPDATGSVPVVETMGIALVSAFVATVPGLFATMTAT
jgi:hypothetical protein